jgi:hypothetical protein
MYVRLGFSIAAHLDPDILLIDEVLAVGDAAFQEQCLERIRELRRGGTTAVFISHDLGAVQQLCDRVLLIERGRIAMQGAPQAVVQEYRRRFVAHEVSPPTVVAAPTDVTVTGVSLSGDGESPATIRTGDPLRVRVNYATPQAAPDVVVEAFFYSPDARVLYCQYTTALQGDRLDLPPGGGSVEFAAAEMPLQPGEYVVCGSVRDAATQQVMSWFSGPTLTVRPGRMVRGHFYVAHDWRHVPARDHDLALP